MTSAALVKQPLSRFILKEDQDIYYRHRKQLFGTGAPKTYELRMVKKDGTTFWVHMDMVTAQSTDGIPECRIVMKDITARLLAEETLKLSESKYRSIFENAVEGIFQTSPEGLVLSANPALARMFGYDSPGEFMVSVGDLSRDLYVNRDDRAKFKKLMEKDGKVEGFEVEVFRKDKSKIWILYNARAVYDENKLLCYEGTTEDITSRKQAEEEIHKLNAELEQRVRDRTTLLEAANKELEAFCYSVSHDLRSPLRGIDGFSLALLEDYQDILDDTAKSYLDRVRKATQHMGQLIDDLLKLSRVTRSEFRHESVDLSTMVRAIFENLQQNNPGRTVDVIIRDGVFVNGDPYLLQIALENLVDNAWKFTGKEVRPQVEFGTTVREGKTVCFIRDNGVGFDIAYVDKLFSAFQRLHTSVEFPGTGIGLATVQRIIHRHGGQVWAEGEVGKGATFYFTIA